MFFNKKVFSTFKEKYKPSKIKGFIDRRWFFKDDNFLYKLDFELETILKPDYRYVSIKNSSESINKTELAKKSIYSKFNLPLYLTETQIAKKLGYSKIWDCGKYRYIWKK